MSWGAVAKRQHGVITRQQLLSCGVSGDQVDRLAAKGALSSVTLGVYLARGAPRTHEASLWIAVLTTRGVLAFGSASHVWGMLERPPARITVLIAERRHVAKPAGVRVRRRTRAFSVERVRGLPVTTRPASLLDYLSELPLSAAGPLLDRGVQQGWLSVEHVHDRLRSPMWGNTRLRALTESLDAKAASEFERRFHRALRRARLTGWTANAPVRLAASAGGRPTTVDVLIDVAFERRRLAIELDGMAFHTDATAFQRDRQRQNALVAAGWRVLRFTWHDLASRPEYVIATIRAELARKPAPLGAPAAPAAEDAPKARG